jgi:hypothetical protein
VTRYNEAMRFSSMRVAASVALLSGSTGAGCGGGASTGGGPDGGAGALPGASGTWTWVDVAGMQCDDGSSTGVAINPAPSGAGSGGGALFVYFMGGGACWDAATCFVLNTTVHGPFAKAQWDAAAPALAHALDRGRASNPFREASYVFVPYCTGDLHAGNNVASYDAGGPRMFAHVGRRNVEALLPRVVARWPAPAKVVLSGSSAGGFGATLNYDLIRRAYPGAEVALVDDAGPLLEGDGIPADERSAWYANWHLGDVVDPVCVDCRADLSQLYPALVAKYPQDRMALLTSLQDQVIRTYFLIALGADFEQRLRALVADRLAPTTTFRSFAIPGESHTLLGALDTTSSGGVALEAWLTAMLTGDPSWASVGL